MAASLAIGWGAIGVLVLTLIWSIVSTRQFVAHLRWADDDDVVAMKSGWLWQQITLARVNKIQAVAMHDRPSIAERPWHGYGWIRQARASFHTALTFRTWITTSRATSLIGCQ